MIDSEYIWHKYKTLKIGTGVIGKDPEMLKFIPDYLETKIICKNVVKKFPFVIMYPDRFKTK